MSDIPQEESHLRVSAHVLVQLGGELVTDVEQAILECVKNAYDADSPGCRIDIDSRAHNELVEVGPLRKFMAHTKSTNTVRVSMHKRSQQAKPGSEDEAALEMDLSGMDPEEIVERHLTCTGRITISDSGDGIPFDKIKGSWLMISGSAKRVDGNGPKEKTNRGRTPLGDKGLGRLGTMKLGDVLLVESATSKDADLSSAQFRWTDCETAVAVDDVPVTSLQRLNKERLKGTRVSILGLNDLLEWRRPGRVDELARSLARLVSPFEATTTFPVTLTLDGHEHSLMAVTNQVLSQAVAEFTFKWKHGADGKMILEQSARFKKALFGETRSDESRAKYDLAFGSDDGEAFVKFLDKFSKTRAFTKIPGVEPWFLELKGERAWEQVLPDNVKSIEDPGAFTGAFYFFHMDAIQDEAASGISVNRRLVKQMAGISILRDGFQVRSQTDWLELATAMTGGSSYHMRVSNTIGYFALSGQENFGLTEKSDREGFVEDSAYRGFHAIALECKKFANSSLEGLRRALDAFYAERKKPEKEGVPLSGDASVTEVAGALGALKKFQDAADGAVSSLNAKVLAMSAADLDSLSLGSKQALDDVQDVVGQISKLHAAVRSGVALDAFEMLRLERNDHRDQLLAMVESAAVGLSARGLAHELRTHLGEIRYRLTQINRASEGAAAGTISRHVNSIRASCSAIMSAASLIDPLLPRSRAIKDSFTIGEFVTSYWEARQGVFERDAITVDIKCPVVGAELKVNRARMLQVLDNLVKNSAYWVIRGDSGAGATGERWIEIEVTNTGYIVSDSGPGVDPHYEYSLFDMFVSGKQNKDGGQGLGLFICKQLLQADGCDLSLLSDRNKFGRRFKFEVDLSNVKV